MKNINKFLFALLVTGMLANTACRKEEELNLADMPETHFGLSISGGSEENPEVATVEAVYDGDGKIVLNGPVSRTITVTLPSPSKDDLTVEFEPLIKSIPEGLLTFSDTKIVIPAGDREGSITMTLADEDFTFVEEDSQYPEFAYEAGLQLKNVDGYLPELLTESEAKVVVDKVRYAAGVSFKGANGNSVSFERSFYNGEVLGGDEVKTTFKAVLDRPARYDVVVSVEPSGVDAEWLSSMTFTPATVTIPAGEKESTESITWTMNDDIMMTDEDAHSWPIKLTPVVKSDDVYAVASEAPNAPVSVELNKAINAVRPMESLDDLIGTRITDCSAWKSSTNGTELFDNNISTYFDASESGTKIQIDLGREVNMSAIRIGTYSSYGMSYEYVWADVAISKDGGQTYGKIGAINEANGPTMDTYYRVISFYGTIPVRYLQLTIYNSYYYYAKIGEVQIYEGEKDPVVYAPVGEDNVLNATVAHTPAGSFGSFTSSFYVRTNIPSNKGYTATVAQDNSLVASYNSANGTSYEALPTGLLKIENATATIAAKAYKSSNPVQLSYDSSFDLSTLTNKNGYLAPVKISSKDAPSSNTQGVVWVVVMPVNDNFMSSPTASDVKGTLATRTGWTATTETGGSISNSGNIFDGNNNTAIASNVRTVVVDMQSERSVKGITFYSRYGNYGDYYDTKKVRISTSLDGSTFEQQGELTMAGTYTNASYWHTAVPYVAIQARYIKFEILEINGYYYGLAEFNIYE